MQPEMGRHLIFWWGLRAIGWQYTWMEGICWCRVVPTTMWAKITNKDLILQACRIFLLGWHLLFWGGGPMSCFYVEAKSRSQYISHTIWCPIWVGVFLLGQGDGLCTTWPDGFGKQLVHMLLAPWKKENLPKIMWPSNFEGDGLHLNLLKSVTNRVQNEYEMRSISCKQDCIILES